MVNPLKELRAEIANCLSEAGIRTVDYAATRITPPLAVVQPDDNYISVESGTTFGAYVVTVQVLVLGPNATAKVAADQMDDLLWSAVNALDEEFDIVSVTAPGEARLDNATYFGSIITIETNTSLGKDI